MRQYGLLGKKLSHTFSPGYFNEKFDRLGIAARYDAIELPDLEGLRDKLPRQFPALEGLNVTIPYKKAVIPWLDDLDATARETGAVNTIDIRNGAWIGYNTDVLGFQTDLLEWLAGEPCPPALVLGTGGAAAAVAWVLRNLPHQPAFHLVSRDPAGPGILGYHHLRENLLHRHTLVINTTPLGMYPDTDKAPPLPFEWLGAGHRVYDLVYNPAETLLMKLAADRGAAVRNGLGMLHGQAEAAWAIWSKGR